MGNIIFSGLTNDYPNGISAEFSELVEMSDSSIIFSAGWLECDVIVGAIIKYDKNWNEIATIYTSTAGGHAARLNDDSFVLGSWGSIGRWDANGNQLWDDYLLGFNINDLAATAGDTLLLATNHGLLKMTADGDVVDTLPNLIFNRLEILPDSNFLAQLNDVLYLYSPNFDQLAFFQFQGDAIVDFAIDDADIAVLTTAQKIVRLSHNLTQIGTTQLVGHNQTFYVLEKANEGCMVGGSERYGTTEHGNLSAFIKEFALNGNTANTAKDVALTHASNIGQILVVDYPLAYHVILTHVEIELENTGQSPINQVTVNMEFPTIMIPWECPIFQTFSKTFNNLNLLPGGSKTVDWEWIEFLVIDEPTPGQTFELCFWTSLPDHHLETNNDNDVSCTEVLVAAHEPFPIEFEAYFLPSSDEVYLDLPPDADNENSTLSVFNAAGQLLGEEALHRQEILSMGHLPDGLYLFRVAFENRMGWAKVVKY
ncbi:MAG: T9SS type A sorting domain-containing protein [Bacteroidetes bacterium]|nr:T9SS type A sorting domain-containing protein [Bacteroidota bacterium]